MIDYKNKKIIIIGIGLTGISCVNFFMNRGVKPRIMDTRIKPPYLKELPEGIDYYIGGLNNKWLLSADLIVVSPGITLSHPSLCAAINAGIEIVGDVELFCREAEAPIIAITGSNGKSTVTTLVSEMAKTAGINVGVGGNIGLPALTLLDFPYELYILELSSFQLETIVSLQATVATILNITEDHMDRYLFSFKQYRAAKLRIYKNAKTCVINANDRMTLPISDINKNCISFGVNVGDYRLNCKKTWLYIRDEKILNVKDMKFYGQHNYMNALAALSIADNIKLPRDLIIKTLTNFSGLPHRFQLVLERNGIKWINDSKATNIGSTKAALNSLNFNGILHLLLGGDGKSADFSSIKPYLNRKNTRLYCFGYDKARLAALCPEITEQTETLEQAMYMLAPRIKSGDIVLLSPACSSIDQFENFEHRGNIFTSLAKELS